MKTIFLTGATGYIGGTILHELTTNYLDDYEVTALVRSSSSAEKVKAAGAKKIVIGDYGRTDLLEAAGRDYDVIIHTGDSADHAGAANSLLEGISNRPFASSPVIYIHTSGTGVITDSAHGDYENPHKYDDLKPEEIDTLDIKQPHREIDVFVRDRCKALEEGRKVKGAIIIPPNIHGIGSGPVNRISQQIPALIRFGIRHRFTPKVGAGINWWNNVHVKDLARAYLVLLQDLEKSKGLGWRGYWFAETEGHQWRDIYTQLGQVLYSGGLVYSAIPESPAARLGGKSDFEVIARDTGRTSDSWGSNSRCRASKLRALGWKKVERDTVLDSIVPEVNYIVQEVKKRRS